MVLLQNFLEAIREIRLGKMHPGEVTGDSHHGIPPVQPPAEHSADTPEHKEIYLRDSAGLLIVRHEKSRRLHGPLLRGIQKAHQGFRPHNLLRPHIHLCLIVGGEITLNLHRVQKLFPLMAIPDDLFNGVVIDLDISVPAVLDKVDGLAGADDGPSQVNAALGNVIDPHLDLHLVPCILEDPLLHKSLNLLHPFGHIPLLRREQNCKMIPVGLGADFPFSVHALRQGSCDGDQKLMPIVPPVHHLVALELDNVQISHGIGLAHPLRQKSSLSPIDQIIQIPDINLYHILVHQLPDPHGVPDCAHRPKDNHCHDQKQNKNNAETVILYELADAGQGVDIPLQHIIVYRPGVNGENRLAQNPCKLGVIPPAGHGNAVFPAEDAFHLQVIIPHFRTQQVLRQISIAEHRIRPAVLHRIHTLLLCIAQQKGGGFQIHHIPCLPGQVVHCGQGSHRVQVTSLLHHKHQGNLHIIFQLHQPKVADLSRRVDTVGHNINYPVLQSPAGLLGTGHLMPGEHKPRHRGSPFHQLTGQTPALSLVLIEEGIISVKVAHHHLVRPGDIILLLRGEHNCLVQTALVELVHELCLQLRLVHLQIRNGIIQLPHHIVIAAVADIVERPGGKTSYQALSLLNLHKGMDHGIHFPPVQSLL